MNGDYTYILPAEDNLFYRQYLWVQYYYQTMGVSEMN